MRKAVAFLLIFCLFISSQATLKEQDNVETTWEEETDAPQTLAFSIAKAYAQSATEWEIPDLSAFLRAFTQSEIALPDTKAVINAQIARLRDETLTESDCAKAIIILKSIGADPAQLYELNKQEPLNAPQKLLAFSHYPSVWSLPNVLVALSEGDYGAETQINEIVSQLLSMQTQDGCWDEFGTTDTTANVIAALAPYSEQTEVSEAIEKAIAYLSSAQKDDGSFDDGQTGEWAAGVNANSIATVIYGLCACGVDAFSDERFVKNGSSAVDALMRFALSDNSGFGYIGNTEKNDYATEQGFRALVAALYVRDNKESFRALDFSALPSAPARETDNAPQTLAFSIAKAYESSASEWEIADLSAFLRAFPQSEITLPDTKAVINAQIARLRDETLTESDCAKAIIILKSIGADPAQLYELNKQEPLNAPQKLLAFSHYPSVWSLPNVLVALSEGDYGAETQINEIVSQLLSMQTQDGCWDEFGTTDTTANVIAALAPYSEQSEVGEAIEKAIAYLSSVQKEDGSFDDGQTGEWAAGVNANSIATVIYGLCACGVDAFSDERFVKNGSSAVDALMRFALSDNSGFGYIGNTEKNDYATEQGFRALVAALYVRDNKESFRALDFSALPSAPARETDTKEPEEEHHSSGSSVTVTVSVKPGSNYWLKNKKITLSLASPTAYDAIIKAFSDAGITQKGAENGYIQSVSYNGTTLSEFSSGVGSGWLFSINGDVPGKSIKACKLSDGDAVLVYFTGNWEEDPGARRNLKKDEQKEIFTVKNLGNNKFRVSISSPGVVQIPSDDGAFLPVSDEKIIKKSAFFDGFLRVFVEKNADISLEKREKGFEDVSGHWAENEIIFVTLREIFNGTAERRFSPDITLSRAMLVTALYRFEGAETESKAVFPDVLQEDYFCASSAWANENKIVLGKNGSFAPDDAITREELATILWRYWQKVGKKAEKTAEISAFSDGSSVSEWARDALSWAVGNELIKGRSENTLAPREGATRAEAATVLHRLCKLILEM